MSTISIKKSWIPSDISWQQHDDLWVIETTENDPHLLEFMATGVLEVPIYPDKTYNFKAFGRLSKSPIKARFIDCSSTKAVTLSSATSAQIVPYYFHGAIFLPDNAAVAVLAKTTPLDDSKLQWFSQKAKQIAVEIWFNYQDQLKKWKMESEQSEEDYCSSIEKLDCDESTCESLKSMSGYSAASNIKPTCPSLKELLSWLTIGTLVPLKGNRFSTHSVAVRKAITLCHQEPPRDGCYDVLLCQHDKKTQAALVTWYPRLSLPSYPEIRCAVQRVLPKALKKPRLENVSQPGIDTPLEFGLEIIGVHNIDQMHCETLEHISDLWANFNISERAENARHALKEKGTEAFGWYQPYHFWSEVTWGIYLSAEKIDDFACMIHEDLRNAGESSHALAMILALQNVYQHEIFHARVEACLSWLELTNIAPRFQRYQQQVYQSTHMTDECLEEALANWTSFAWLQRELPRLEELGLVRKREAVEDVLKSILALSPPGYRNWQIGAKRESWRTFASELVSGKSCKYITQKIMPLESLLADQLPFDMIPDDIPIRIIGKGAVVDSLLSSPANFAVPARREIERALRYFGYTPDKRRGKGSHELWSGNDNRSFPIPCRDPLSRGVFNSFLHHFGLDKATYVFEIRPQI